MAYAPERGDTDTKLGVSTSGVAPIVTNGRGVPGVAAPVGSIYVRLDGGASTTLYIKESGTGSSGWVAK